VIGTVMRHGYKLGENVLRHALVGVVDTVAGETGEAVDTGSETEQADTSDNHDTSGE
jgi:molecular chaperone GrpE